MSTKRLSRSGRTESSSCGEVTQSLKPKRKSNSSLSKGSKLSSKYHNQYLFDYSREETKKCMDRLSEQAVLYELASDSVRRKMRVRALLVAAFTLNATAIWTAKLLAQGKFSMVTQVKFFKKRWKLDPKGWGENAKSCFARALSGYSIGKNAVCVDRHLERMELNPKNAAAQWRHWFRLYESMYGPGETVLCVRWHIGILDWISGLGERPKPWK